MASADNSEVVLMVHIELHPDHKDEFLRGLSDVEKHVRDNEPHTLAYHIYTDRTNRNIVHLYERYVNEHAWHEIHEKSGPFLKLFEPTAFKRRVKDIQIKSMSEAGMGFISR